MTSLLNVDRAIELILMGLETKGPEHIGLTEALGRVAATDIIAPINLPPFANSALDGFAVVASDMSEASEDNPIGLTIVMDIPAGSAPEQAIQRGEAARIMTGAPMPEGANAVVPVEDTNIDWEAGDPVTVGDKVIITRPVKIGAGVRHVGESAKAGDTIITKGTIFRSAEIGMVAGLGMSDVLATQQPRVTIISSGDELVPLHEPLTPGKIYDSNSYSLMTLVKEYGGIPTRMPVARDTLESVRGVFEGALAGRPDMIISSAGVSVGTADLVRGVLSELGSVDFWRINLRPGKPLAFGHLRGVPFFGLPGNPVSAMVTFEVIVRPALLKLSGSSDQDYYTTAVAGERITTDGRRSYERVTLTRDGNQWVAHLTGTQSSGALMSMVLADALMIVPEDMKVVEPGTMLPVKLLRQPRL
ncbi:MAG: molybdopterin molybdotransferase MoeA [Anaerolineaceae bacterium]|nr:molybdopterin molybdotransferase MoeA [Anaerolineaceae bacterium]